MKDGDLWRTTRPPASTCNRNRLSSITKHIKKSLNFCSTIRIWNSGWNTASSVAIVAFRFQINSLSRSLMASMSFTKPGSDVPLAEPSSGTPISTVSNMPFARNAKAQNSKRQKSWYFGINQQPASSCICSSFVKSYDFEVSQRITKLAGKTTRFMKVLIVALLVFLINIPFGSLRAGHKKFTLMWWLYIHIPVPFVILLRIYSDIGFALYTYPILVGAFFGGQLIGRKYFPMKARQQK